MKRRDFLKIAAPLSMVPLTLNGMAVKGVMNLFEFNELLTTDEFKGRHVVIVQMRGANDGLNTVVPFDQFDNYVLNRPTIHLPKSVLTTELDASLPDNQRAYLNPNMTGTGSIQSLYDEGKVNIIQGIGYPTPNYSHFRSTDIVLGAKDGGYGTSINEGWLAGYLATVYPGFLGQPTQGLSHPLGIQIGDDAQNMGYRHEMLHNVGVNISSLSENSFYSQLSRMDQNHYQELLGYVESVDSAAAAYNKTISDVFENGSNIESYPDTYLANQLQTVARLLSGGLQSKLLLTDMNGFDTHVNQVAGTGSDTATGNHANLLAQFSDAVYSFQKDIEALGLADKVVIVTMSEFGRKVAENGNKGTDHGDLSSWMVIGNGVSGGVTGRNIDLSPNMVNSQGRTEDVMQHDYRRMLSAVMQDWLGNTDTVLGNIETDAAAETLLAYGGAQKLDIFKTAYKVDPAAQVAAFSGYEIIIRSLIAIETVAGWTYYGDPNDANTIYFGVEHTPTGGNTLAILPSITVYNLINDGLDKDYFSATEESEGNFILGDFWNVDLGTDLLDGFVNIRFFVDPARVTALENVATAFKTAEASNYISTPLWVQTEDPTFFDPQSQVRANGFSTGISSLGGNTAGTYNSRNYVQFNSIETLGNKGGGMAMPVTSANTSFEYPTNPKPGTLVYNHNTGSFEGWNGNNWVQLNN
jgi:uncharacterized protein (DUF1501 family)